MTNSCVSILPSLQNKPSYKWQKIHLLKSFAAKAPSPPGTECCLQGNSTGELVREKDLHIGRQAWAKFTCHRQTCSTLHTGQPGVNAVACFGECCLYDGSTQDGCGSSDLRVSMVDEAKNVADVLLLCKRRDVQESETLLKAEVPVAPWW